MKEDLIKKLVQTFKQETENYSNELEGVINYKCEEFFKKNNPDNGYHSVDACIFFKEYTLKLEYKINISMLIPKSTVEMRFMFENGKLPVEFSIYDLFNIIDENNFKCYTFGYVSNEQKMRDVLKYLVNTFNYYKKQIEQLSLDMDKITLLENDITNKVETLLNEKVFESRNAFYMMHMLELYYVIDVSRFTTDCYIEYLNGEYKKAIKHYNRMNEKLTSYEIRLIDFMKNNEPQKAITDELNTLKDAIKLKNRKKEFLPMFISWLILTPIWYLIYNTVFCVTVYLFSKETLYFAGALPYALLFTSFVTAIINSYFVRRIVYKIFFRKDYQKIIALDQIENSEKIVSIMSRLFQFIIALGLVFSLLLANTNITFYDSAFRNNLKFLDLKGQEILYSDVECVYKAQSVQNAFGQVVNNPAYIIGIKGGDKINLYYYMAFEDIEKNIIPIFEKHNIEIREIDKYLEVDI